MNMKRLMRDINDGIIVLDYSGTILEMNPKAREILGLSEGNVGKKYFSLQEAHISAENDGFHQMILETVYNKNTVNRKRVSYCTPDDKRLTLNVASSILLGEKKKPEGVILSFSDITEEINLENKVHASSTNFIIMMGMLCLWIFIYGIYDYLGRTWSSHIMSKTFVVMCMIPAIYLKKRFSFTYEEVGLGIHGIKKYVIWDIVFTVIGILLMILLKTIILASGANFTFYCKDGVFWDWSKYSLMNYVLYLMSAVGQEFISRGIVHESVRRILDTKHNEVTAIIISSMIFGAVHVHVGIIYMVGAALLLGILGIVYNKQKTIWGLCIPHFVLGMALGLLGYVEG